VLIFIGVIGGLIGFGIIGLFVGPVVLAVAYTLLMAWVAGGEAETKPPSSIRGAPTSSCSTGS
jgi:predicted PurR-regulated permease PerM